MLELGETLLVVVINGQYCSEAVRIYVGVRQLGFVMLRCGGGDCGLCVLAVVCLSESVVVRDKFESRSGGQFFDIPAHNPKKVLQPCFDEGRIAHPFSCARYRSGRASPLGQRIERVRFDRTGRK
jgi:hypothetical protein